MSGGVRDPIERFRSRALIVVIAAVIAFFVWFRWYERRGADERRSALGMFAAMEAECDLAGRTLETPAITRVRYTWRLPAGFQNPGKEYSFHIGFTNADGAVLWDDDHDPPRTTASWSPGKDVSYERTVFLPPVSQPTRIHMIAGLEAQDTRDVEWYSLNGARRMRGKYSEGTFRLIPPSSPEKLAPLDRILYKEGWHKAEWDAEGYRCWRWMTRRGICILPNLHQESRLLLRAWAPRAPFRRPTDVSLTLNGLAIATFTAPEQRFTRLFRLPAAVFGTQDSGRLEILLSQSFEPRGLFNRRDPRELGLMVHALVMDAETP